jgi:DNA recombination protein RmuC
VAGQRGLYGKVGRFAELSAKAGRPLPPLEPLRADFEVRRLDDVVPEGAPAPGPDPSPTTGTPKAPESDPSVSSREPNP